MMYRSNHTNNTLETTFSEETQCSEQSAFSEGNVDPFSYQRRYLNTSHQRHQKSGLTPTEMADLSQRSNELYEASNFRSDPRVNNTPQPLISRKTQVGSQTSAQNLQEKRQARTTEEINNSYVPNSRYPASDRSVPPPWSKKSKEQLNKKKSQNAYGQGTHKQQHIVPQGFEHLKLDFDRPLPLTPLDLKARQQPHGETHAKYKGELQGSQRPRPQLPIPQSYQQQHQADSTSNISGHKRSDKMNSHQIAQGPSQFASSQPIRQLPEPPARDTQTLHQKSAVVPCQAIPESPIRNENSEQTMDSVYSPSSYGHHDESSVLSEGEAADSGYRLNDQSGSLTSTCIDPEAANYETRSNDQPDDSTTTCNDADITESRPEFPFGEYRMAWTDTKKMKFDKWDLATKQFDQRAIIAEMGGPGGAVKKMTELCRQNQERREREAPLREPDECIMESSSETVCEVSNRRNSLEESMPDKKFRSRNSIRLMASVPDFVSNMPRVSTGGDYHRPLRSSPTVPPPATPVVQHIPGFSLLSPGPARAMIICGTGLAQLRDIIEHVKEVDRMAKDTVYKPFKTVPFVGHLLDLIRKLDKFARCVALGDDESRALFKNLSAEEVKQTQELLLAAVLELTYGLISASEVKGTLAKMKIRDLRLEMVKRITNFRDAMTTLIRGMEAYVGAVYGDNGVRIGKPEHVLSLILTAAREWHAVDPPLHDKLFRPWSTKPIPGMEFPKKEPKRGNSV